MQRPPRPEPTRISRYFFEQLQRPSDRHDIDRISKDVDITERDEVSVRQCTGEQHISSGDGNVEEKPQTTTTTPSTETEALPLASSHALDLKTLFDIHPTGPHRDGAGQPAPIFSSPSSSSASSHDLQQVLWTSFTPRHYTDDFAVFLTGESDITERLRRLVADAWVSVEKVIQRNHDRRAALVDFTRDDAAWRDEIRSKMYWQAEDIVSRYGLEVGNHRRTNDDNSASHDDEHVLLDFSLLKEGKEGSTVERMPLEPTESQRQDDDEDGESSNTKMEKQPPATNAKDLLDFCARPHPLRRIFAPLQRERDILPKWTNLLFQDMYDVQRSQLPDLEARLHKSVLFKVPLHRPFLAARAALQTCARQSRAAPAIEAEQVTAYRQVEQLAKRLTSFLKEKQFAMRNTTTTKNREGETAKSCPVPGISGKTEVEEEDEDLITDMGERWATAETLWTMLFTELDTCKRFIAEAVPRCTELHETVTAEMSFAQSALENYRASCEATLANMKTEARTCSELLMRNGEHTLAAVKEMEENFIPDQERLKSAIARRKQELMQLETQQEKNVRRVREALKACFVDQVKYEEAAQALLQDQISLAQLETSHQQLRLAVQARHKSAVECTEQAALLSQLLEDGDTIVHTLFHACEAHQRRMIDDDYFIQCRLMDQCTLALQQRCRCLHAMAALYDQRYATLERRAGGSWQLQFLLSGERDWAMSNLTDVRAELTLLKQDWEAVQKMRAAMAMDPAELDAFIRTAEWAELKSTLLQLDAPPTLQRELPVLRVHSATLAHPAAGCGSQAARRLMTS